MRITFIALLLTVITLTQAQGIVTLSVEIETIYAPAELPGQYYRIPGWYTSDFMGLPAAAGVNTNRNIGGYMLISEFNSRTITIMSVSHAQPIWLHQFGMGELPWKFYWEKEIGKFVIITSDFSRNNRVYSLDTNLVLTELFLPVGDPHAGHFAGGKWIAFWGGERYTDPISGLPYGTTGVSAYDPMDSTMTELFHVDTSIVKPQDTDVFGYLDTITEAGSLDYHHFNDIDCWDSDCDTLLVSGRHGVLVLKLLGNDVYTITGTGTGTGDILIDGVAHISAHTAKIVSIVGSIVRISYMNNGNEPGDQTSSGDLIEINLVGKTGHLVTRWEPEHPVYGEAMGSFYSLGDSLVVYGWGTGPGPYGVVVDSVTEDWYFSPQFGVADAATGEILFAGALPQWMFGYQARYEPDLPFLERFIVEMPCDQNVATVPAEFLEGEWAFGNGGDDPYVLGPEEGAIAYGKLDSIHSGWIMSTSSVCVDQLPSGIDGLAAAELIVFPNPISGDGILQVKGVETITIYNLMGQQILSQQVENGSIQLPNISSGTYIVTTVAKNGQTHQQKLVVY